MTLCAQCGTKHDDVLDERAMQDEHGAHCSAGIVEHPTRVGEYMTGMSGSQLLDDGLDGVVQATMVALSILYGLLGDGRHFGGREDVAWLVNQGNVEDEGEKGTNGGREKN